MKMRRLQSQLSVCINQDLSVSGVIVLITFTVGPFFMLRLNRLFFCVYRSKGDSDKILKIYSGEEI